MIIVIRTGSVCRVIPPVEVHRSGDKVQWLNRTGQTITVFVRAGIFDAAPTVLNVEANNSGIAVVVKDAPLGLFPYSIYCYATDNNAIGSSDPEIIIEP